jgi:hypothetical protein
VTRVIAVEGLQNGKIRVTESREFAGLLVGGTMKCPSTSSILTVLSVSRMMSWWLLQGGTMSPAASFGRTSSFATAFSFRATRRTTTRTTSSTTSLRGHYHHHHHHSSGSSILMLVRDRQRRRSISTSSTVVFSRAKNEPAADAFLTENSTNSILNDTPLPIVKHNHPGDNHHGGRYGKLLQEVGLDHIIAPDTDLPSDRTVSTMDVFCNRYASFRSYVCFDRNGFGQMALSEDFLKLWRFIHRELKIADIKAIGK